MAKRKVYLILNPCHSPCQIVFASLSKYQRDAIYEEMQMCDDLECAESVIGAIHPDVVERVP